MGSTYVKVEPPCPRACLPAASSDQTAVTRAEPTEADKETANPRDKGSPVDAEKHVDCLQEAATPDAEVPEGSERGSAPSTAEGVIPEEILPSGPPDGHTDEAELVDRQVDDGAHAAQQVDNEAAARTSTLQIVWPRRLGSCFRVSVACAKRLQGVLRRSGPRALYVAQASFVLNLLQYSVRRALVERKYRYGLRREALTEDIGALVKRRLFLMEDEMDFIDKARYAEYLQMRRELEGLYLRYVYLCTSATPVWCLCVPQAAHRPDGAGGDEQQAPNPKTLSPKDVMCVPQAPNPKTLNPKDIMCGPQAAQRTDGAGGDE